MDNRIMMLPAKIIMPPPHMSLFSFSVYVKNNPPKPTKRYTIDSVNILILNLIKTPKSVNV